MTNEKGETRKWRIAVICPLPSKYVVSSELPGNILSVCVKLTWSVGHSHDIAAWGGIDTSAVLRMRGNQLAIGRHLSDTPERGS